MQSQTPVTRMLESCDKLCRRMQAQIDGDSGFILHCSKWRCLARSYNLVLDSVKERLEALQLHSDDEPPIEITFSHHDNLAWLLEALHGVMKAGEGCLQDCTRSCTGNVDHNSWLVDKALRQGITTEIVDLHLHDLVWCYFLLEQAFVPEHLLQGMTASLRKIWEDEREEEDLKSAVHFLDGLRADGAGSSNCTSTSIAEFLSRRLAGASELEVVGPNIDVQVALPEYLWVPQEELKSTDSLKIIGGGAYGVISEVEWRGGRFAVKQSVYLQEGDLQDGNSIDPLEGEASIQVRLRHPNVTHLVCCSKLGRKDTRCSTALVMELMHTDLRSLLLVAKQHASLPFSHLVSVDFMLQVAKGMEYLHSLGIMHRDLKSSNILASFPNGKLCPTDDQKFQRVHLKIADFGMSKAKFPDSKFSTKETGATRWRAPEVFNEDENGTEAGAGSLQRQYYTNKADVYSFGLICYEILTGNLPFEGIKDGHVIGNRVRMGERPELPGYCPLALASFIRKCWHSNPSVRPTFTQICRMLRYFKACLVVAADDRFAILQPALKRRLANRICETVEKRFESQYPAQISRLPRPLSIALEMFCSKMVVEGRPGSADSIKEQVTEMSCLEGPGSGDWAVKTIRCPIYQARGLCSWTRNGVQYSWWNNIKGFCILAYQKTKRLLCQVFSGGRLYHLEPEPHASNDEALAVRVSIEDVVSFEGVVESIEDSAVSIEDSVVTSILGLSGGGGFGPANITFCSSGMKPEGNFQSLHGCLGVSARHHVAPAARKARRETISPRKFSYRELVEATQDFHGEIAEYGAAYTNISYHRGCLDDGTEIAVKKIISPTSWFAGQHGRELMILSEIRHNNFVPMLGWCRQGAPGNTLHIVYKYMPNGSLEHIMFHESASTQLSWKKRYRLIIQLAAALKYLHENSRIDGGIAHGDVRPCNIMLDSEWNARLEHDTILNGLYYNTMDQYTANIAPGIKLEDQGYVAPELLLSGQPTPASDVHGFGVTVLALACGRKALAPLLNSRAKSSHDLRQWVWQLCQSGEVMKAADEQLAGVFDGVQLRTLLVLGLRCSNADPNDRPTMEEVLHML